MMSEMELRQWKSHSLTMAANVGNDESEFESITSSQKSFLKNCPFADPEALPTNSTDSDRTEVLGNQISPAVVRTPILSFSSPTSLDSINDDVFRTPPENASLSSAADSEPRVRVSEIKPRKDSNLKSPSSMAETTPVSASSSEYSRVLETNRSSDSVPLSSPPSDDVRVPRKLLDSDSSSSPTLIRRTMVLDNTGASKSTDTVMKMTETENANGDLPFKEIIEALLRNSGENLNERDKNVSYVEILKQCGLKFP